MLFNYIKIAFRNLIRKKVFTAINVIGLSVGAASALLIFLYVQHELSYDRFLEGSDQIYRFVEERKYPDRLAHFTMTPSGFATVLSSEIPEVEECTRLVGFPNFATTVRYKDNVFPEHYFFSADSNFFEFFHFKLLKGSPQAVLRHQNTIVLTASTAARYFGDEDPMGKSLKIFDNDIEVVGVMEDVPANSHMKFDALTPSIAIDYIREPNFYVAGAYTYVRLSKGANPQQVEQKFVPLVDKYVAGPIERDLGVSYKKYIADGNGYTFLLQPLSDIHLTSHRVNEIKANGDSTTVNVMILICVLILVIAGINFVNLATARSAERAREVGVRKVLGGMKQQLVSQFLFESLLISVLSVIIALAIVQGSLGFFNNIYQMKLQLMGNTIALSALVIVTVLLGIISGLYPAFYISALKPVLILKGKFQFSSVGHWLRNGLVVFQFTISIVLISATLVVYDQLSFLQNKSLGFEKENVVVINHLSQGDRSAGIHEELRKIPGITSVGATNSVPGGYFFGMLFRQPGSEEVFTPKGFTANDDFASTMNLKIVQGRGFSREFDDSLSVVINERAVKALNLKDPVGAILTNNPDPNTTLRYTIVGVVQDFNFESLHLEVAPLIIMSTEGQVSFQSVVVCRLEPGANGPDVLKTIEAKWKELLPTEPFVYQFMDSRLQALYSSDRTSGKLLTTFTLIAIIIACVGLFGLTAYTANQRTKEIGVRKVLGATAASILKLLSRDFAKLVIVALLIGSPIAWFMMDSWLSTFAFRVSLQPLHFVFAGLIVAFFTMITVSYQSLKAALGNPVDSLKED
ncbi:MAG: ABC transporter permease [Cyclobacteriaceae bacterium]|nr:ABC transporter permease [Cyclobacteriaceae bacterium]